MELDDYIRRLRVPPRRRPYRKVTGSELETAIEVLVEWRSGTDEKQAHKQRILDDLVRERRRRHQDIERHGLLHGEKFVEAVWRGSLEDEQARAAWKLEYGRPGT